MRTSSFVVRSTCCSRMCWPLICLPHLLPHPPLPVLSPYLRAPVSPPALFSSLTSAQLHRVKETSILYQIYAGYYRSSLTCRSCHQPSHTFEPFLDLSLSIPVPSTSHSSHSPFTNSFSRFSSFNQSFPKPPPHPLPLLTLHQCLSLFTSDEHLDSSNMYRCSHCKQRTKASKRLSIYKAPAVLVVHLKRFEHSGMGGGKIGRMVGFDQVLDLRPYMSEGGGREDYDLYAVLVHAGGTMMSGHYFSYCKAANGRWYCMNDESVREVQVSEVLQQKAYMLFYTKRRVEGKDEGKDKEQNKEMIKGKGKEEMKVSAQPKEQLVKKQLVQEQKVVEMKESTLIPSKLHNGVRLNGKAEKKDGAHSSSDSEDDETEQKVSAKPIVERKATPRTPAPASLAPPAPLVVPRPSSPPKPVVSAALSSLSSPPASPQSASKKRKVVLALTPSSTPAPPSMPSFATGSLQKYNAYSNQQHNQQAKRLKRGEELLRLIQLVNYSSSDDEEEVEKKEGKVEQDEVKSGKTEETKEVNEEVKSMREVKEETKEVHAPHINGKRGLQDKNNGENEERKKRRLTNESRINSTPSSSSSSLRFDPHSHRHAAHSQYSTSIPSWDDDTAHERERADVLRRVEQESRPREKDEYDREYDRGRERKVRGKRDEMAGVAVKEGENLLQRKLDERREESREDGHSRRDSRRDGKREHRGRDRGRDDRHRDEDRDRRHSSSSHHRRHSHSHHSSDRRSERDHHSHGHRHDRRHSDSHSHRSHSNRSDRR